MKKVWWIIYNIFVMPILFSFFAVAKMFNEKIKSGFERRKNQNENIVSKYNELDSSKKLVWFHSASLGEFEQAKPIIKKLRMERDVNILITFFSPSGYDNSLKYPYADIIAYLPFDFPKSVREFIGIVNPSVVVFMRYDIWPNLLWNLCNQKIPSLIVDATMVKNSRRKWILVKSFHFAIYKCFNDFLTVSDGDLNSFLDFGIPKEKIKAVGDTRFDRVYQKSLQAKEKKLFRDGLLDNKKVLVFGSAWEEDENVMFPAFEDLLKLDENIVMVIAPHEPTLLHLEKIENYFADRIRSIRFSSKNTYSGEQIIIIDSIGILLTLYYYADVAYVGGSFKQGIHNVLEPAVYGIPVIFGPKISGSLEANELVRRGASEIVNNKDEALEVLSKLFLMDDERKKMGKIASDFVNENVGATNKIITSIEKYL